MPQLPPHWYFFWCGTPRRTNTDNNEKQPQQAASLHLLDAAKDLNRNQPHHLRVTANGVTYEDDYIFGAVSNAKKLAGIIELPEGLVDTNDGRLEVFLVKAPKSLLDWDTILRGVVARDFSSPFFELTQAEEIWIDNEPGLTWSLDGECSGEMDRIHIVPKRSFLHLKT